MDSSTCNPLISGQRSSQLQAVLHPLVLLNISDYITRHTLREQEGPIVGALLGQQNGREITIEHAFECHTRPEPEVEGGYLLDADRFGARLEQLITVHKERQLDFVGWYTLLPSSGPTSAILPLHSQILQGWNESSILLGFHPQDALNHTVGSELPLTIYESHYEVDESKNGLDGEDRRMDDGESTLRLKFRRIPYSVETDETEMISMNYVAGGGGHGSAAASSKDDRPTLSIESNGKGKRRLVESDGEDAKEQSQEPDVAILTRGEEEMLASLTAKANAIKMLHSRIRLLVTYLERLPPSCAEAQDAGADSMETDNTVPSLTILRQIQALVSRLDLVVPSNQEAYEREMLQKSNDVNLLGLLNTITQSLQQAREVGKKFNIVESARTTSRRPPSEYPGPSSFTLPGAGDILI